MLSGKDAVNEVFKHYKSEIENQFSKMLKLIRSYKGGQYESTFEEWRWNGVVERKNRTFK